MSALLIVGVGMPIIVRLAWPALLMAFILVGVTSPATALGVIIGLVVVGAAALRERTAGRPL